jgi:hypothetical protein
MAKLLTGEPVLRQQSLEPVPDEKSISPIKLWAGIGGIFVALQGYVWLRWLLSGNLTPTPTGPTPVPNWMKWTAHGHEVLGVTLTIVVVYLWIIRPRRRQGRASLDGLIAIAMMGAFWQDPLSNINGVLFVYNTAFVNWGSWVNFLPFNTLARANLYSEPIVFELTNYIWCIPLVMIWSNQLMRAAKRRWPELGQIGLVVICGVFVGVVQFILEIAWIRALGLYAYPSGIRWMSIWAGHWYQYPIHALIWIPTWIGFSFVRYYRNDRGETICERGVSALGVSPKASTGLRLLALTGVFNVIMLVTYSLPNALLVGAYGDAWPNDVVKRSYMTNGLCGPGTTYRCPDGKTPSPRPGDHHVDLQGRLVPPDPAGQPAFDPRLLPGGGNG